MKRREYEVLMKFKDGDYIDNEYEMRILEDYASVGCVHFGVSTKGHEPRETAKLIAQGISELELEGGSQNRLKRIIVPLIRATFG